MEYTINQLLDEMVKFILPFFRIGGFFMVAPLWGAKVIPKKIRLFFAFILTLCLLPTIADKNVLHTLDAVLIGHGLLQLIIGILLGFSLQFLFQLFSVAGQFIALQAGLGFSQLIDPQNGVNVTSVSQLFNLLVVLLFLSFNGHLALVELISDSFQTLPINLLTIKLSSFSAVALRLAWVFHAAVMVALPAVIALFIINIAFGVMTRAAPQLNLFTVGFPITLVAGLVLLWLTLKNIPVQFDYFYHESLHFTKGLLL